MKRYFFLIIVLTSFCVNTYAQSKRKIEANKKSSVIKYAMKHPMHDWDAKTKEAKAVVVFNDQTQKIEAAAVVIPVKSFDSGNGNRDSHALEVLDALKIPNVSFSSNNIQEVGSDILLKGNFSFHGVTKIIDIKATKNISKNVLMVKGAFDVNMKDYKVEPPGLMGIKTNEIIKLSFELSFDL